MLWKWPTKIFWSAQNRAVVVIHPPPLPSLVPGKTLYTPQYTLTMLKLSSDGQMDRWNICLSLVVALWGMCLFEPMRRATAKQAPSLPWQQTCPLTDIPHTLGVSDCTYLYCHLLFTGLHCTQSTHNTSELLQDVQMMVWNIQGGEHWVRQKVWLLIQTTVIYSVWVRMSVSFATFAVGHKHFLVWHKIANKVSVD